MSAPVLLHLLNELGKEIKCGACQAFYPFFAMRLIYSIIQEYECYCAIIKIAFFCLKTVGFCHIYVTLLKVSFHSVSRKSVNH